MNHHIICWKSIEGKKCHCEKVHIDIEQYAEKPMIPVVQKVKVAKISPTVITPSIPKPKTLGDFLREGDWSAFVNGGRNKKYTKIKGKNLMCKTFIQFGNCRFGEKCNFAHTTDRQTVDLPLRLVNILETCDNASQMKIVNGIREEILRVIDNKKDIIKELIADQAITTEFEQFNHTQTKQESEIMKKKREKKTHDSKQLRKFGRYIENIRLHRLSEETTIDLMKLWRSVASNDHKTFALFERPDGAYTFLLEDFVWEITRLCAIKPCFTWTHFDKNYNQTVVNTEKNEEWTTVEKKVQQKKIDPKDLCFGGINCKKGRHSHKPPIDIKGLYDKKEHVNNSYVLKIDEFTSLNETLNGPNVVVSKLDNWNSLTAKNCQKPIVVKKQVEPKRVIPTPVVETYIDLSIEEKQKKKKKKHIELSDEEWEQCKYVSSECYLPSDKRREEKMTVIKKFTNIECDIAPVVTPMKRKKSKKNRKTKDETLSKSSDTFDEYEVLDFSSHEKELLAQYNDTVSRVTITRPKRAKKGEQIIISTDNESELKQLKHIITKNKTGCNFRLKGSTLVFSTRNTNAFENIFAIISKAFDAIGVDIDTVRLVDEKKQNFEDYELTKISKQIDSDFVDDDYCETSSTKKWWDVEDSDSDSEDDTNIVGPTFNLDWADFE